MKNSIFILLTIALIAILFSCEDDSNNPTDPSKKVAITSVTPDSVYYDDIISIKGINFGSTRDSSYVSFEGILVSDYISWNDTEIKLKAPDGTQSGKLWIVIKGEKSNEVDFILKEIILEFGTVSDIDGNNYKTVKIGTQWWMADNLKVSRYRNGNKITNFTDDVLWRFLSTGAWRYYDNDASIGAIYGKLYNWYAVNDPRGLAPEGWHIPSDEEWKTLEKYLGMSQSEANRTGDRGTNQGSKLAGRADLWFDGILEQNQSFNSSGFSALPGSWEISSNNFLASVGFDGNWWSATENDEENAWSRDISCYYSSINRDYCLKYQGFSVRCVKD